MRLFVPRALTIVTLFGVTLIEASPAQALARTTVPCGDETLFLRVLSHPGNAALNIEFARQAEACGDLRHAFAALERAVVSNPGDTEAQAEFDRVRNKMRPAVTLVTVEGGASYATNLRQLPKFARDLIPNPRSQSFELGPPFGVRRPDAVTYDARIAIADDRTIAGLRWRTLALAQGHLPDRISSLDRETISGTVDISDLQTTTLAAESGPVFQITPDVWLHVAGGAAIAWLEYENLYDDASASVTIGGLFRGLTQTATARYTWRNGNFDDFGVNNAQIFDLEGSLVVSPSLLAQGDLLNLLPRFQVSQADGIRVEVIETQISNVSVPFVRPLFPGDFTEAGGTLLYNFPLFGNRVFLGVGIGIYHRWYDEFAGGPIEPNDDDDEPNAKPKKRRDTYIEATSNLTLANLFAPNMDLRFDYRYERSDSNARTVTSSGSDEFGFVQYAQEPEDFENHVAGVHIVGRF